MSDPLRVWTYPVRSYDRTVWRWLVYAPGGAPRVVARSDNSFDTEAEALEDARDWLAERGLSTQGGPARR
jgi:hypothetical protein